MQLRLRHGLWWCLLIILAPLLLPQALYARRHTLRLPEAVGERQGVHPGRGAPLRLLLLGESTAVGVGVAHQQQALAAQLAEALAQRLQSEVQWRALGENGITAARLCDRLLPTAAAWRADLVVVVLGVNDTTHLSSPRRWRQALQKISEQLTAKRAQLVFSAVPPLQHFHALPWLLRQVLGVRARLMDRLLLTVATEYGARHCALGVHLDGASLAQDGFHPSASGYREWAQALADDIVAAQSR